MHVIDIDEMFYGVISTMGYLSPKVADDQGLYSAVQADLPVEKHWRRYCSMSPV